MGYYGVVIRQGTWQDRISFWSDASKNTTNAIPHINLGMAYIDNNDLDQGIGIFERILNSDFKSSKLMGAIAYNNLGIAYLKKGQTAKAKQVFLEAVEKDPGFHKSYYHIGIIYLSKGLKQRSEKDLEIAKDYFLESIKIKKNYARAYLSLAKIYLTYGQDEKSKRLAKLALKYGLVAPMDQQARDILNLN